MSSILSLDNVYIDGTFLCTLKLAPTGLALKVHSTSNVYTLKKEEIREIELFRSTQKFNMRIHSTLPIFSNLQKLSSNILNINNVSEIFVEGIKDWSLKHFNINVYQRELEINSVNYGRMEVLGDFIEFKDHLTSKIIFDVDLGDVENFHEMKNELTLSFSPNSNFNSNLNLNENSNKNSNKNSNLNENLNSNKNSNLNDNDEEGVVEIKFVTENESISQMIKDRLEHKKGTVQTEIVTFESIQSLVPRGKNDYIFHKNYIRMIGGTYEHKILYTSFKNIFVLEKENNEFFISLQLNPPIRQGQTRYNFIVIKFGLDILEDFSLNLDDEDRNKFFELKEEYSGPLGNTFVDVVTAIFNSTMSLNKDKGKKQREVVRGGSFETVVDGRNWVKSSLKAHDGYLYPLDKSLLFLPKGIYMPLKDINLVEFFRVNVSSFSAKTFDMKISTIDSVYMFTTIPKEEFGQLEQYFSDKNIKATSEIVEQVDNETEDEEDDEEEESGESSSGNE